MTLERASSRGAPSFFPSRKMSVFGIKPQIDGLIRVATSPYKAAAPYQLAGTDAEIDGDLLVTADRGVEVVQDNEPVNQSTSNLASCSVAHQIPLPQPLLRSTSAENWRKTLYLIQHSADGLVKLRPSSGDVGSIRQPGLLSMGLKPFFLRQASLNSPRANFRFSSL
jgi:hypothetical protein